MTTHRHHPRLTKLREPELRLDRSGAGRLQPVRPDAPDCIAPTSSFQASEIVDANLLDPDAGESLSADQTEQDTTLAAPQSESQPLVSITGLAPDLSPDSAPGDSFLSPLSPPLDLDNSAPPDSDSFLTLPAPPPAPDFIPSSPGDQSLESSDSQPPDLADALNTMIDLLRQIAQNTATPQPAVLGT
jgi:hypothetical protein